MRPLETKAPIFLTAQWRHLAVFNYEVAPEILAPHVPPGTELDLFQGRAMVSLVGFLFLNTKVWGLPFPFHRNFEEVNLRFYVRFKGPEGWRRGVVFFRELVPRWGIATVARWVYHEPYVAVPMWHGALPKNPSTEDFSVSYGWRFKHQDFEIKGQAPGPWQNLPAGSEPEFILEHYWGYNRQPNGTAMEYAVEHPPWRYRPLQSPQVRGDFTKLYGETFGRVLAVPPASAYLAEGSEVLVRKGIRLRSNMP